MITSSFSTMKLFLYSLHLTEAHAVELSQLVGKNPEDTTFALIENAADVIPNSKGWVGGIRNSLKDKGYQVEPLDLRKWINRPEALREKLRSKDVIWLGGGNSYYLRWILKASGADEMIQELVKAGKVYAGWSAGAIVAGPTLQHFDAMGDDPKDAAELILEGLQLTELVVVPHMDHPDFIEGAEFAHQQLLKDGFYTVPLNDSQALMIHGEAHRVL